MNANSRRVRLRPAPRIALACAAVALSSPAVAAPIDVGNEDWSVRLDNTVKYNVGVRAKSPDPKLIQPLPPPASGAPIPSVLSADDGDRNFRKGGLISNRIDLFSEFDAVFRKNAGLRISGAAWYDDVYNRANDNTSPATNNSLSVPYDSFTGATRRLHGRNAEVLDAFVFGGVDLGSTRLTGRLGKHTVIWGESLFFGNNGIASTQAPVDAVKAASVPGSTTKEILMPVGQLSGQWQLRDNLAIVGFYQYDWRRTRLPGAGSYFSAGDFLDAGGERLKTAVGVPGNGFARGPDLTPHDSGQGGIGLKSRIDTVDFGLYAVRFHSKTPVVYTRPGVATGLPAASIGQYQLVFPEGIRAFGASATTSFGTMNVGIEGSVRRDTPLTSNAQVVLPGVVANNKASPLYAIGNSAHLQMSVLWTLPKMAISAEPSLAFEVAANRMTSCKVNCAPSTASAGRPYGALDPNATRDAWGVRASFAAPQRNVLDGLDLTPSINVGYSSGRSSVIVFGPDKGGDVTLALAANYLGVWDMSISFTHYYGPANSITWLSTNAQVNGTNTYGQALRDRDFLSLSVRRTF
jgi:hypothetical protein